MPYIDNETRDEIDPLVEQLREVLSSMGDLNYTITRLCDAYLTTDEGIRYARLNDLIGALECAKLELYRRVAAPYEDKKAKENGDAYDSVNQRRESPPIRSNDLEKTDSAPRNSIWKRIMGS